MLPSSPPLDLRRCFLRFLGTGEELPSRDEIPLGKEGGGGLSAGSSTIGGWDEETERFCSMRNHDLPSGSAEALAFSARLTQSVNASLMFSASISGEIKDAQASLVTVAGSVEVDGNDAGPGDLASTGKRCCTYPAGGLEPRREGGCGGIFFCSIPTFSGAEGGQENKILPSKGGQENKSLTSKGNQKSKSLPSKGNQKSKSLPSKSSQESKSQSSKGSQESKSQSSKGSQESKSQSSKGNQKSKSLPSKGGHECKSQSSKGLQESKCTETVLIDTLQISMAGQHYCLRWNNYQSNMTSVFHQLLRNEAFVDVTLACNDSSLKAHKVVLSACSSYFQKLLLENPCKHPTIIMPQDVCFSDLKFIIEFVYRGEIDVSQAELQVNHINLN
uniref:BTB domain-containing protein n=1 Tax=Timema bartmani TaxID=61472 RepID=A0A7R9ELU2_9NEOP|nr:unnamed protein product [Timema bartmani]